MNFLHAMGAKVIGCSEQSGSIQGLEKPILENAKPCFSEEEWQRVAEGYNTLGRLAAEKGMQVCLHHHMGTGIQTTAEIDKFMSLVDDKVFLLYDTGHAWYSEGGEEPMLAILKKYLPRINHVHLKDVRPPVIEQVRREGLSFLDGVKGTFTVPGDGVIDFRPVFKLLDEHGYKGWMVVEAEQDPALANPFEYAVKRANISARRQESNRCFIFRPYVVWPAFLPHHSAVAQDVERKQHVGEASASAFELEQIFPQTRRVTGVYYV